MISNASAARPYYEALFSSIDNEKYNEWDSLLKKMSLISQNVDFQNLYKSNILNKIQLSELFLSFFDDSIDIKAKNFINLLIDNKRLLILSDIYHGFKLLKDQKDNVNYVSIISAFDLSTQQIENLSMFLEKKFLSKLKISISIDKNLIGGIRIKFKDKIIDASVQHYLCSMKESLLL
ncbi:ATP synthase subunit delta [Candidatus Kinetoplastibacterium sorsogonicusi]|uniref:ATP synthase subunit delta n=1 Tax=Candidatus Kinetoplastidibacterium kentomonadis TaxID=1576550 RepID=A0A3S7J941_9PROT|nr:F0F1 ATP synthase subunit delta [Candidatus Kinetoplastibacterium sorsogonicusi]AWD32197.1 ATP synthase subunit delta [Candidatus Kinetoplastibacterium sorsogonicusi]